MTTRKIFVDLLQSSLLLFVRYRLVISCFSRKQIKPILIWNSFKNCVSKVVYPICMSFVQSVSVFPSICVCLYVSDVRKIFNSRINHSQFRFSNFYAFFVFVFVLSIEKSIEKSKSHTKLFDFHIDCNPSDASTFFFVVVVSDFVMRFRFVSTV